MPKTGKFGWTWPIYIKGSGDEDHTLSWLADEVEKERSGWKNNNVHGFNSILVFLLYISKEGKKNIDIKH